MPRMAPQLGCQSSVLAQPLTSGPRHLTHPFPHALHSHLTFPSHPSREYQDALLGTLVRKLTLLCSPSTHVGRRCQPLPGFVLQVSLSSKLIWGCPLGYSVHSPCPLSSRLLSLPHMATPASLHQAACFCVLHPPLFWCPQRLIAGRDPGNALWKATCPSTL